jgi:hypothetical protein
MRMAPGDVLLGAGRLLRFGPGSQTMNLTAARFPLSGADLVLIGMSEFARAPANNAVMVVECSGRIAPARLRTALHRFIEVCPWPAARLKRPFPWGALHWVAGAKRPVLEVQHRTAPHSALTELVEIELRTPIDPTRQPLIRFLIVDHEGEARPAIASMIMTWYHALMDPRGAQNFLQHLCAIDAGDGVMPWGDVMPAFVPRRDTRPFLERARIASKCYYLLQPLAAEPPRSPGSGAATDGALRFHLESFIDTAAMAPTEPAQHDFWHRLAIVGLAVAEIARERGWPDHPLIVPVSLDQRRKGDAEPTFGNMLGFHFARFRPTEATSVEALARLLRNQVTNAIREDAIDTISVGLEFLKFRRPRNIALGMPWAASGDIFSFACADIGAVPPMLGQIFGARVINAYHAATIGARPGLGVFFNRAGDTNNLVVCWTEGALEPRHVTRIVALVQSVLAWEKISARA